MVNINLNPGQTCTFLLNTSCGVPFYKPSTTYGFDLESLDYNPKDVPARLRFLQTGPPAPPPPAGRMSKTTTVKRRIVTKTTSAQGVNTYSGDDYGTLGPLYARYHPEIENGTRTFKGGKRSANDHFCETRFSLLFVTNLKGVSNVKVA